MKSTRIPLFPLPLVLFPGGELPLHIFEPRYKQMIGECSQSHSEFGIVLSRDEGIARIGCTAEIIEITREYPDGSMDIGVEGRSIFELTNVLQEKSYFEAVVQYLKDEPDPKDAAPPPFDLVETYRRCHELLFGEPPEEIDRAATPSLAFHIAGDMPLDLEEKQALLAIRNEHERQALLLPMLLQLIPRAELRQRMRLKASGNGHSHA
jgi:Lon protease-like protein